MENQNLFNFDVEEVRHAVTTFFVEGQVKLTYSDGSVHTGSIVEFENELFDNYEFKLAKDSETIVVEYVSLADIRKIENGKEVSHQPFLDFKELISQG